MMRAVAELCVRRRRTVVTAWLALALLAGFGAMRVEGVLSGSFGSSLGGQAERVRQALAGFPSQSADSVVAVIRTPPNGPVAGDPAFNQTLAAASTQLQTLPQVGRILSYRDAGIPRSQVVSKDGHTALLTVGLKTPDRVAAEELTPNIRNVLRGVARPAGTEIMVTGPPAVWHDMVVAGKQGTTRAELVALPLTALLLLLAFGTLTAAAIPLLVGVASVSIALAALYLLGHLFGIYLNTFAQSITTILGLAVGIDYSLLMVARYREHLAAGATPEHAAINTTLSAGRAVAFSGGTVTLSLAALLIPNSQVMRSVGYAGVIVVAVAVLAALTAVPALLAWLGPHINALRVFGTRRRRQDATPARFWGRWARAVMRRPALSILVVAGILLTLAAPTTAMIPSPSGIEILPQGSESRRAAQALVAMGELGAVNPLTVLIDTGTAGGALRPTTIDALYDLTRALEARPDVGTVLSPTSGPKQFGAPLYRALYRNETLARSGPLKTLADLTIDRGARRALLTIVPTGQLTAPATRTLEQDVLDTIRADPRLNGTAVTFGGMAQASLEQLDTLWRAFPYAIAGILLATFLLLTLAFRSLLIPLKAIVLNGLSVLASFGILVAVFQYGWGTRLLGIQALPQPAQLCYLIPVLLFAIVFGLSMDYEVFLVSRIQEAHHQGYDTAESVALAIERTGPIITWAAAIMVTVFLAFLSAPILDIKETGLPLAIAVLLDATLVRLVLAPALMKLAGRWNWWLPAPLARALPQLELERPN